MNDNKTMILFSNIKIWKTDLDVVEVDAVFVSEIVEHVQAFNGRRSPLLEAENQVDPLVQLAGHYFAFQSLQCLILF